MGKRDPWIPRSDYARKRARGAQWGYEDELKRTLPIDTFRTTIPVIGAALVLFLIFGKPCINLGPEGCIERGGYALFRLQWCLFWSALLVGPPTFLFLRYIRRRQLE